MNIGLLDTDTGVSAAGTTQGTAQLLVKSMTVLSTVASGAGVLLLPNLIGVPQMVYNGGANACKVYPPSGYSINQLSANTALTLPINTAVMFWTVSSTQLVAFLSA